MMENNLENSNEIVPTNKKYNYMIMKQNIEKLKIKYPFLEITNIGYSVLGKQIPCIRIGKGNKEILYHASIHGNEWITSILLMKFVEDFCKKYVANEKMQSYLAQELFNQTSLYIVPMVNPDTVDLVTGNIDKESSTYKNYKDISKNYPQIPFPDGWKANFNGESLINFHFECCVSKISL